ncbi:MAG: acetyl/propionyl/methylcrotonyl-CoA carboxylase subunit alpha [Novosphingobium sp.]|nr:acetyl/propionyl/methylcrotonyl-CoA carboxylase subunit alpha [Novosphingobium sp.]
MIKSLLIANRGEIACRIIRTARAMGIRTVAVYSDADAKALHVRQADEALHIGPSPAIESYLVGEKIIAAAEQTGAEAIHPGYGFLSENAEFAQSVIDAGLVWVGPKPASITAMGLKDAAKKLMDEAGVPVTPGYLGEDQSASVLAEEAAKIGYPVLIKAVAGGGGKGMRLVESEDEFADALQSCQREAASSFGNDHVLIEKYILSPRHIEVQVFGDTHGNVVHLFERDCSLQRRHQKVIEEAPAPGMDEATRETLCAAAVRAAKAVDYVGAGTIEFIADGSEGLRADRIWFMEMNTRLQVEHPVTEEITGVDLVEWQLRVASGEALPLKQEELSIDGWAMEARLYAEDPAAGFLPSVGRLERYAHPQPPIRIETGVEQGDEVSSYYDPMIAKYITHAATRDEAIFKLADYIPFVQIWPVITNSGFLHRLLVDPTFVEGDVTTGFISELPEDAFYGSDPDQSEINLAALNLSIQHGGPIGPFRLNRRPMSRSWMTDRGHLYESNDDPLPSHLDEFTVAVADCDGVYVTTLGRTWRFEPARQYGSGQHSAHDGDILSPMPGKIIAVEVAQGETVNAGQKLLTLEAMKMEHTLTAPFDGVVAELNAEAGGQVQVEALLARIEAGIEEEEG